MTRKPTSTMTPEQVAAHAAECDGCSICHGEPPTAPALRRRITAAWLGEVFKPGYDPQQPTELLQLLHSIDAEQRAEFIAAQRKRSAEPRKLTPELIARIVASRDDHIAKKRTLPMWRTATLEEILKGWQTATAKAFDIDAKTIKKALKADEKK